MSTSFQRPNPEQHSNTAWTEPPWTGWIETTGDALLILEAAQRGIIPRITRRLVDEERKLITSGSVFVFDEDESGIKRWTDGRFWSPSRILDNFLLYRETDIRHRNAPANPDDSPELGPGGPPVHQERDIANTSLVRQRERTLLGSLTNSYKFKPHGLMKKTFSLTVGGVSQHLISYYKVEDVGNGKLRTPSSVPELAVLAISAHYLDATHFRYPPKLAYDADSTPRYIGEGDKTETPTTSSASSITAATETQYSRETSSSYSTFVGTDDRDHVETESPPRKRSVKILLPYSRPILFEKKSRSQPNARELSFSSLTPPETPSSTSWFFAPGSIPSAHAEAGFYSQYNSSIPPFHPLTSTSTSSPHFEHSTEPSLSPSYHNPLPPPPNIRGTMHGHSLPLHNHLHNQPMPKASSSSEWSHLIAAKGALEHIKAKRNEIISAMGCGEALILATAGFNEELVRQGSGYLQEIHLFSATEFSLALPTLSNIGKLCSPFPCKVFMPSGLTFCPPIYSRDGKTVDLEEVILSSVCKMRYKDLMEKPDFWVAPADNEWDTSMHSSMQASTHPLNSSGQLDASSGSNLQPQTFDQNHLPREEEEMIVDEADNRRPGANEHPGIMKKEEQLPQAELGDRPTGSDPPEPEDSSITSHRARKIHFDVVAAIHNPPPHSTLLQELQITGNFTMQSVPGEHTIIQFQKLKCQTHGRPGRYQYTQFYLKVLIDTDNDRWLLQPNVSPKDTSASDGQERHTSSQKNGLQQAVKVALKFNPFGAGMNLEGTRATEASIATERLLNCSRIVQRERDGVFWWGFQVDDKNAREGGTDLSESRLPFAEMEYFRNRTLTDLAPIKPTRVEVSSFWSLIRTDTSGWFSKVADKSPPPAYSNLCQMVCMDLSSELDDDAIYKAKINFGASGLPLERVQVRWQNGIVGNPYVLPLGDDDKDEAVERRYLHRKTE